MLTTLLCSWFSAGVDWIVNIVHHLHLSMQEILSCHYSVSKSVTNSVDCLSSKSYRCRNSVAT
nr:MAG TPA: hypothetical protein [Crassvirales sp.]